MSTLFLGEMDALNPPSSPFHQPQPPFTSTSNKGATSPAPPPPCRPPRKPSLIFLDGSPSTTFVQVQPSSFKQVVQMLTSSREQPPVRASSAYPPPSSSLPVFKKASCCSPSKLLDRRRSNFRNLKLAALSSDCTDSSSLLTLSPSSLVDLTDLSLSPVTPLGSDSFTALPAATAEENAIAGKGFYLHPTTPRGGEESVSPAAAPTLPDYLAHGLSLVAVMTTTEFDGRRRSAWRFCVEPLTQLHSSSFFSSHFLPVSPLF